MTKLTFLAAAFAAGLTTFAASAKDISPKAEKPTVESAIRKSAEDKKNKKAEAKTETVCPYLFGCRDKKAGELDETKTASIGPKGGKAGKTGKVAYASGRAEKRDPRYGMIVARYASSYGIPVSLAHAVIRVESNYRPNARGSAGEIGLMQIKPATARMMGYSGSAKGLYDPETNIKFGMKYLALAHELGGGTTCGTILKYNAGHAAKRMNRVSSAYCSKVKRHLAGA